jgi:hypothetical protein
MDYVGKAFGSANADVGVCSDVLRADCLCPSLSHPSQRTHYTL